MLSILTTFKICCSVRVKAYRSTYDVSSLNTSNLDKTNILLSSRVQLGVKETFVLGYAENLQITKITDSSMSAYVICTG